MPDIRVLTEAELRQSVQLDLVAVDCIEDAFRALAGGDVSMPPILSLSIEEFNGEVDVKTAYVPGIESFAVKISPGFFDNPKLGLPSTSGLMVLFASRTGQVEALLLDNGYLTDVRTAAAGAVAARHLSRSDSESVAILGTGMQARLQLQALTLVRPIRRAIIWGRDSAKAEAMSAELAEGLGIEVSAATDPGKAVPEADIIVTTTPTKSPILMSDWLRPGQHVTAMGSDQHNKNELDPGCLARADIYVADRLEQTSLLGELRSALETGTIPSEREFPELGHVIAGDAEGRTAPDQITIVDLTGTGVQDTAIATLARKQAADIGIGTDLSS